MGFYHEQERPDRDGYVKINFLNILKGTESNFEKENIKDVTDQSTGYDYLSIMQYGSYFFSKNNLRTVETLNPYYQDLIGQRGEISITDKYEVRKNYRCPTVTCALNLCDANHAYCSEHQGGVECTCNEGYQGNGYTCTEIPVCTKYNGGCSVNAYCMDFGFEISCECKEGFRGDGTTCEEIRECGTKNGGCSDNASCRNIDFGIVYCECNEGFQGDGYTCEGSRDFNSEVRYNNVH